MSAPDQPFTAEQQLAIEQAYQDRLIARRLPGWLGRLDIPQLEAVNEALKASLHHRQQLAALLKQLQPIDDFVKPALRKAMAVRYGREVNIDQLYLRKWYYYYAEKPEFTTGRWPQLDRDFVDIPLYTAVLDNFTADDATGLSTSRRDGLVDASGAELEGGATADFAAFYRQLDLGSAYQRHLEGALSAEFAAQLAQMLRQNMLVDTYKGFAEGALNKDQLELVVVLCRDQRLSQLEGAPVVARQLRLRGCELSQIVVLQRMAVSASHRDSAQLLVYIPADPKGAWSVHSSLEGFVTQVLQRRLPEPDYQRFFARFVRRRDSQRFFANDLGAGLRPHLTTLSRPLFEHLPAARIAQIKDDAAMLLTPTAQVDRVVQAQRDQWLKDQGWAVVSIAGLFVPALGVVVLAVTAWEMLQEVYQAIETWRDGDSRAALEHLTHVAKDVALIALTGVAVGVARRVWAGSTFVDGMVPAQLQNGSEKLWNQNLEAFRCEAPPAELAPDARGIYPVGEHDVIEMDGHHYRVVQRGEDQQWQILPQGGHGPLLRHNGAGAWRLWGEQPAQWDDTHRMFRRLGAPFNELDDTRIDQVLANQGLTADDLRALHVYGRAPDAELRDAVERSRLAGRLQRLIACLREDRPVDDPAAIAYVQALPAAARLSGPALGELAWAQRRVLLQQWYEDRQFLPSPGIARLRRLFPSLHVLGADAVLRAASDADRQALQELGQIRLGIARTARASALRIRSARVIEALQADTPQNLDLARVVLRLLDSVPGAAQGVAWRLFDGDASEPLLTADGSGRTYELVHQQGLFRLRDALAVNQGPAGELFDVLVRAYGPSQRHAMGLAEPLASHLRQLLARRVVEQHAQLPALLGAGRQPAWWVAPQRLGNRLGYPLSCCPRWFDAFTFRPRSLAVRVLDLYPDFEGDEPQLRRWLEDVSRSGRDVDVLLRGLEQQFRLLDRHLKTWVSAAANARLRVARRQFRAGLVDCWRYIVPEQTPATRSPDGYRWSWTGQHFGDLPVLPAGVEMLHVSVLEIENSGVLSVPDEFLQAFPNVRSLELMGNRLRRLPSHLPQLRRLQSIDLYDNRVELDPGQSALLASCESLTYLNLSRNPLHSTFSVHAMPHLAELRLSRTGITRLPFGIVESQELQALDISYNRLRELPQGFYDSLVWRRGHVLLEHNDLLPDEYQRLVVSRSVQRAEPSLTAPGNVPVRLLWLDLVEDQQRPAFALLWTALEDQEGSDNYFDLLRELTQSADFVGGRRADLADRLMDMMQVMSHFDQLRDELFAAAQIETCGDGAAVHFSELEVRVLVWQAEHGAVGSNQEQVLVRLARRLWRLSKLNGYARWDYRNRRAQLPELEEIEVVLAYNVKLRDALDLPVNTARMRFALSAKVDDTRAAQARDWVCSHETEENLANWMVQCRFWQRYLETAHAEALRVPDHFRKQLATLHTTADIQALQAVIDVQQHECKLTLTLEALHRIGGNQNAVAAER